MLSHLPTTTDLTSISLQKKVLVLIGIARPLNCLMSGFAVLIGEWIALGFFMLSPSLLGFIVAFTLTAAAMVINDYYDVEVDLINSPEKPLPSGAISPGEALAYAVLLSLTGLIASVFINVHCFLIACIALILLMYYNTIGKRTGFFGNVIVSTCISFPFIFGGFAVETMKPILYIFTILAILSNLGREIIKGIAAQSGDSARNIRTIAVSYGPRTAALVASGFFTASIVVSWFPLLLVMVSVLYLPFIVATDVGFASSSVLLLKDYSASSAKREKNKAILWMIFGLLSFVAGNYSLF